MRYWPRSKGQRTKKGHFGSKTSVFTLAHFYSRFVFTIARTRGEMTGVVDRPVYWRKIAITLKTLSEANECNRLVC